MATLLFKGPVGTVQSTILLTDRIPRVVSAGLLLVPDTAPQADLDSLAAIGFTPAGSLAMGVLNDTTMASGTYGPFTSAPNNLPIWLTLSGTWAGLVELLRSTDGGVTKLPATDADGEPKQWINNINAAVAQETIGNVTYYLKATLNSGRLNYRLEQ